ncbi:MAG: cytochrome c3 family protein [Candidatus Schekmanbacteria bacterium]|nr:cytochrome c3 family protein [Candidatus Schekmanbacteria bacterium]
MRKLIVSTLATALAGLVFALPAVYALEKGPAVIDLNAQKNHADVIKKPDKKHVPSFPHHDHQDKFVKGNQKYAKFQYTDDWTCGACHHTTAKGEQPESCLKCKDVNKMLEKVGGADKFENIYHQNCRDGCHKAMDKDKQKTGPSGKCKGCHGE